MAAGSAIEASFIPDDRFPRRGAEQRDPGLDDGSRGEVVTEEGIDLAPGLHGESADGEPQRSHRLGDARRSQWSCRALGGARDDRRGSGIGADPALGNGSGGLDVHLYRRGLQPGPDPEPPGGTDLIRAVFLQTAGGIPTTPRRREAGQTRAALPQTTSSRTLK
jgi:hypothetical protein